MNEIGPRPLPTGPPLEPPASAKTPPATERSFVEVLGEARGPLPARPPPAPEAIGPRAGPQAVPTAQRLLESSLTAEKKLDGIIAAAMKGKTFSAAELIALQAEVFRYSQLVEVVSRTTEKVVGSVKQVLGTQV